MTFLSPMALLIAETAPAGSASASAPWLLTLIADIITLALVFNGLVFCLIASIGLVRMPDLYNRMQSATKAGTLGVASIVLGAALHFGNTTAIVEGGLVILFFFGTAPLASHLIGRAAYGVGVPLSKRTFRDDLKQARESGCPVSAPVASTPPPAQPEHHAAAAGHSEFRIAGRRSA